ncbi:MAG: cytochrome c biogenesis protein CcsA [Myxococcota bacterium]
MLLITGAIWAKPTWGVWWSWDPRLTTAAIMFFAYAGYIAMRHFVEEPELRATWSAVVGIMIYVVIPIVWFSVKWWNSLHQLQSSPSTVGTQSDGPNYMVQALRLNAFAFLGFYLWFLRLRYGIARARMALELTEPRHLTSW